MRSAFISAIVLGALAISSTAHADVPPPAGEKRVGFEFTVRGLAATPDRVVFAYPCSTSSGAPVADHRLLEEGKAVSVGFRGGECALYTTTKAKYDAWKATYEPTNKFEDAALDAFAKESAKCKGAPTPSFILKSDDARSKIEEILDVKTLTDASCEIVSTNSPGKTSSTTPTNPSNPSSPGTDSTGTSPQSSDDGGCSVGGARGAGPWLLALGVPVIVFLTSRRRRNEKKK